MYKYAKIAMIISQKPKRYGELIWEKKKTSKQQ